jgi:hypothetical protein
LITLVQRSSFGLPAAGDRHAAHLLSCRWAPVALPFRHRKGLIADARWLHLKFTFPAFTDPNAWSAVFGIALIAIATIPESTPTCTR